LEVLSKNIGVFPFFKLFEVLLVVLILSDFNISLVFLKKSIGMGVALSEDTIASSQGETGCF